MFQAKVTLSASRTPAQEITVVLAIFLCGAWVFAGCGDESSQSVSSTETTGQSIETEEDRHALNEESISGKHFGKVASAREYNAAWPYNFDALDTGLKSTLPTLGDIHITPEGSFTIEPSPAFSPSGEEITDPWSYYLQPKALGRANNQIRLTTPTERLHHPTKASFVYDENTEIFYEQRSDGLKLYAELEQQPTGSGPVFLEFKQTTKELEFTEKQSSLIASHRGEEVFRWTDAVAYDANRRPLPIEMTQSDDFFRLEVDDADAVYPIVIDPLATSPDWSTSGDQSDTRFGNRLRTGDINGSGHEDLLISDVTYSGSESRQGRLLVFLGTSDGFSSSSEFTIPGDYEDEFFGRSASANVDFSDDGCDEIVVGAPGFNENAGRALLFNPYDCTEDDPDLDLTPVWSTTGESGDLLGRSVSTGDYIDCNGNADIVVGAPNRDTEDDDENSLPFAGAVELYRGDPSLSSLIETTPFKTIPFDAPGSIFGWRSATIPEVDGREFNTSDRCDGFAVSAPAFDSNRGQVRVYYHDEDGNLEIDDAFELLGESPTSENERFGATLEAIPSPDGTVGANGVQIDALAVGAEPDFTDELPGYVELHEYSSGTETYERIWRKEGPHDDSKFGSALTGGLNFNGLVLDNEEQFDLAIGAKNYSASDDNQEGGVFVFLGSPDGLSEDEALILDSGDPESDFGFALTGIRDFEEDADAVLVSAPNYGSDNRGRVFLYSGKDQCYIDGEFYGEEEENPNNPCEYCDPDTSSNEWTTAEDGTVCEQGDDCTVRTCQNGSCEEADDPDEEDICDDGNPCTDNFCDEDGACDYEYIDEGITCEDDDLSDLDCNEHVCDGAGTCEERFDDDWDGCWIDDSCYQHDDDNPATECQYCDADAPKNWTNRPDYETACENGEFCTVDDYCEGGECQTGDSRECDPSNCMVTECSNADSSCVETDEPYECEEQPEAECLYIECTDDDTCSDDNVVVTEGCYIDDECVDDGRINDDNPCQVCDPDNDPWNWSNVSDGTTCDSGQECSVYTCQSGSCEEDSSASDANCDDGNDCTINSCSDDSCVFSNASEGTSCSDSSLTDLECNEHVCDGSGTCEEQADDSFDGCFIDDDCYDDGENHPSSDCQYCDAEEAQEDWTAAADGTSCDNGLFCTVGDSCQGGVCQDGQPRDCQPESCQLTECSEADDACVMTSEEVDCSHLDSDCTDGQCVGDDTCSQVITEGCSIDGQCVDEGAENPDNPCEYCDPSENSASWTVADDGTVCEEGSECSVSTCDAGVCEPNQQESDAECSDGNDCTINSCEQDQCQTDFADEGTACEDDDLEETACTVNACDGSGTCEAQLDDAWEGCQIDDQCVEEGELNPDDPCHVCDPDEAVDEWSPGNEGGECYDGDACTENDVCEAGECVGEPIDCGDFQCDDGVCLDSCASDEDCIEEAFCNAEGICTVEAQQPIANAGEDQVVADGDLVTLDGSESYDPDGNELTYQWTQLEGEEVELSDPTSETPTFTAPRPEPLDEDLELQFELVVDDGELESEPDDTWVFVSDIDNEPPVAVIEGPEESFGGETVELDGSESYDPDGDSIVNYSWTHVSGQPVPSINQGDEDYLIDVTFDEAIEEETVFTVGLIVSDGMANSERAEHEIVVSPVDEIDDDVGVGDDVGPGGPMGDGDRDDGGCGCSATGPADTVPMVLLVLMALGLVRLRGARRAVVRGRR